MFANVMKGERRNGAASPPSRGPAPAAVRFAANARLPRSLPPLLPSASNLYLRPSPTGPHDTATAARPDDATVALFPRRCCHRSSAVAVIARAIDIDVIPS